MSFVLTFLQPFGFQALLKSQDGFCVALRERGALTGVDWSVDKNIKYIQGLKTLVNGVNAVNAYIPIRMRARAHVDHTVDSVDCVDLLNNLLIYIDKLVNSSVNAGQRCASTPRISAVFNKKRGEYGWLR